MNIARNAVPEATGTAFFYGEPVSALNRKIILCKEDGYKVLDTAVVVAVQVLLSAVATKENVYGEINQRQSSR